MTSESQTAIDVHAHFGVYVGGKSKLIDSWTPSDAGSVVELARQNHTRLTVVSPLKAMMPRLHGKVIEGNEDAARVVAETDGLLQWVVVNPLEPASLDQAAEMLALPKCVGMKVHPEEHGYPIGEHGEVLFEFAAKHNAVMISHSGEEKSLPADFVPFANAFPEVRLILAHLGCGWDDDPSHQVRAIQSCKHDNVFVDTSSARNITPGLLEWAVREIGAEKILYGTDSPLYFLPMQRVRVDRADISDADKKKILHDNAVSLLGLGA